MIPGLLNPAETAARQHETAGVPFNVTNERGENIFGKDAQRFTNLRNAQIDQQRLSAEAGLRTPQDMMEGQLAINQARFENKGFSSERQFNEAQTQTRETADKALAPVRSNVENLSAGIDRSSERWKNAGSWEEHRGVARSMGNDLTDYVQGLTASGPQAGAYGVNTVQGASQMMGSEFEMSKSTETNNILKAILDQLVKSGKMDRKEAAAVGNELGYRTRDPISQLLGGD